MNSISLYEIKKDECVNFCCFTMPEKKCLGDIFHARGTRGSIEEKLGNARGTANFCVKSQQPLG